jgi:hypothetical protein
MSAAANLDALRLDARQKPRRWLLAPDYRDWLQKLVKEMRREGHCGGLVTRLEVRLLLDEEARRAKSL